MAGAFLGGVGLAGLGSFGGAASAFFGGAGSGALGGGESGFFSGDGAVSGFFAGAGGAGVLGFFAGAGDAAFFEVFFPPRVSSSSRVKRSSKPWASTPSKKKARTSRSSSSRACAWMDAGLFKWLLAWT